MFSTKEIIKKNTHMVESYEDKQSLSHMESYGRDKYDEVVDNFPKLYNEADRKLKIWHARRIGTQKYYQLARQAEQQGKDPARLFTYLLKKA